MACDIVGFEHLHLHSDFSCLDGLAQIEEYAFRAPQINQQFLCCSDHGMMGVIPRQIRASERAGISPIFACLVAGQEIITAKGMKLIEDVEVGDLVLTHTGVFRPVVSVFSRKYAGNLTTLTMAGARTEVVVTSNHRMLVCDGEGTDWVEAGKIVPGYRTTGRSLDNYRSYLCFPRVKAMGVQHIPVKQSLPENYSFLDNGDLVRSNRQGTVTHTWKDFPTAMLVDEDFAYFLGLYCAEGSARRKDGKLTGGIVFSFHSKETYLAERVEKVLAKLSVASKRYIRANKLDVISCCVPLAYLLTSHCGIGSKNKRVPSAIFTSPQSVRSSFVNGLLDGDGKNPYAVTNPSKQATLRVSSGSLAWHFKALLACQGVWANVYKRKDDGKTCYTVPFSVDPKYRRSWSDKEYVYKPVREVVSKYAETTVYNIEVEGDHSYVGSCVYKNCELYVNNDHVNRDDVKDLSPEEREKIKHSCHLLAIARNNEGYKNLVQLSSWGWIHGFYKKPRVTYEQLLKHREGIIFTSCCYNSEIGRAFDTGGAEAADAMIERYMAMFPGQFYLELMLLDFSKQKPYDAYIVKAADKYGLPLIVTNDCHYCQKEDSRLQQYMLMIRTNTTIRDVLLRAESGEDVFEMQDTNLWMKSEEELNAKWAEMYSDVIPAEVFAQAKRNTVEICRACKGVQLDRSVKLPVIPDAEEKLKEELIKGFKWRGLGGQREYMFRLKEEMELINRKGFASYFLIEKQMTDEARRKAPEIMGWDASDEAVGPGRGSAAGSLACYCLGITNVDPIRHGLLFSRFLNENRGGRRMKTRFTGVPLPEPLED
jgi:hypothetical protein